MKNLSLVLLIIASTFFVGCEKDVVGEIDEPTVISQPPRVKYVTNISGVVFDESKVSVEEALVTIQNQTVLTDQNGYFKIEDINISEDGTQMLISKDGYFDNFKFITANSVSEEHIRIQLIAKKDIGIVNGRNGGTIIIEEKSQIVFPERAFVDEQNVSYEGDVKVFAHWYNPSGDQFTASMPGDLRAVNQQNEIVQLSTYGMIAVELETPNGRKLQLADNKTALLSFPVPDNMLNNAPDIIPTWSFDETSYYWIEESEAILSDGIYEAEVSHFSFWNCDAPFPVIDISGKLVDPNGNPLPWYRICILAFNESITGYGWTNEDGGFSGKVPKNQELTFTVKDECGGIALEQTIGPFSGTTTLGEITISSVNSITVAGTLTCMGMPITEGYAKIIVDDNSFYVAEVNENGEYSIGILTCALESLQVQGFDLENNRISEVIELDGLTGNTIVDIDDLEVCEELEEFITFKIDNGAPVLLENPDASIFDGNLHISASEGTPDSITTFIYLTVLNAALGDNLEGIEVDACIINPSRFECALCGTRDNNPCNNFTVNITSFGGIGDFIEGNFMKETIDPNDGSAIMGEFRVRLDFISSYNSVSGVIWLDENFDGIRQSTEALLQNNVLRINTPDGRDKSVQTNDDGTYSFENIIHEDFELVYLNAFQYGLTIANQGADETIDSDFENFNMNISLTFGSSLENFDLGLTPSTNLECEAYVSGFPACPNQDPFAEVTIEVFGGIPPFQVQLGGQIVATTDENRIILPEIPFGQYEIFIVDSFNNACETILFVEIIDALGCQVRTEPATCGENNGTASVDVFSSQAETYLWSNGATTATIENLEPGAYSVTVTDVQGCSTECEAVVETDALQCVISTTDTPCAGFDGSASVDVSCGVGPFNYQWSNGETGQQITGLQEGTYTVTVTDSNNSTSVCSAEVFGIPLVCDITFTNPSCGQNDGSATVDIFGGSGIFDIIWSNGFTGQTQFNLASGFYSVTVVDNVGCETVCDVFLQDTEQIFSEIVELEQSCDNSTINTILIVQTFGGSGSYTFEWSNGQTEQEIIFTSIGRISVLVTDIETGCSTELEYIVESNSSSIGDLVWLESENGNPNVYDAGVDEVLPNVVTILYNAFDPNNLIAIDSTMTNEFGIYSFNNLPEGQYIVELEVQPDLTLIEKDSGIDEEIDSDFDPVSYRTDQFQLDGCEEKLFIDAGFRQN